MGVTEQHPEYAAKLPKWDKLRDTHEGEDCIKGRRFKYLKPTSGMLEDGDANGESAGGAEYDAYIDRARFPDFVKEAVKGLLGVMHEEPPQIKLPAKLEHLRQRATLDGESLEMVLTRINTAQLITGRLGLMAEVDAANRQPYLALYNAHDPTNWDETAPEYGKHLRMVVLNESGPQRKEMFKWEVEERHRVLFLGESPASPDEEVAARPVYRQAILTDGQDFEDVAPIEPTLGTRRSKEIPFVFINPQDVAVSPDDPVFLGLANHALSVYRREADYGQSLFLQGQDTFVTIGDRNKPVGKDQTSESVRTGAGAHVSMRTGGDVKFVGVDSSGLPEQRKALENDYSRAKDMQGNLIDDSKRAAESGEALEIRVSAKTCTLHQLVGAGAFGLEKLLRIVARWVGANPDEVEVIPHTKFSEETMGGRDLKELMQAKFEGAPISLRSVHRLMSDRGLTKETFEDELEQIQDEGESFLSGADGTTNPDGPTDDVPEAEPATGNDPGGEVES